MRTYALGDIHGDLAAFREALSVMDLEDPEVQLILLGDYVDHAGLHSESFAAVKELVDAHPGRVIALMGNIDADFLAERGDELSPEVRSWLRKLPVYFETPTQIFVHAGVDEEAGDEWKWASEDWYFYSKYPAATGSFCKDVIAGHVGTFELCGENRVFWDGASHYYVDGSTEESGVVPVLCYDDATNVYTTFEREDGSWVEAPVRN